MDCGLGSARFVRVYLHNTSGSRMLKVISETERFLSGYEVNTRTGEEFSGKDFDRREHVISKAAIRKTEEYRESLKYGDLVMKGD